MTANELADELDKSRQKPYTSEHLVGKAANMLRQFGLAESIVKQQALDIEEWKRKYKDMHNLATQAMSKVHQLEKEAQMNNEPVAWTACLDCGQRVTGDSIHTCSPQLKTLTDKEILNIAHQIRLIDRQTADDGHLYFARAILRKAQE